jgi:hypothetical protein
MKQYGVPRNPEFENPDCGDLAILGHNCRHAKGRNSSKRIWKKLARLLAKKEISDSVKETSND